MPKKNKVEKIILDQERVLIESANSLYVAMEFAVQHRDVEAILAISDRWLRMYDELTSSSQEKTPIKLGFVKDDNDDSQP